MIGPALDVIWQLREMLSLVMDRIDAMENARAEPGRYRVVETCGPAVP